MPFWAFDRKSDESRYLPRLVSFADDEPIADEESIYDIRWLWKVLETVFFALSGEFDSTIVASKGGAPPPRNARAALGGSPIPGRRNLRMHHLY